MSSIQLAARLRGVCVIGVLVTSGLCVWPPLVACGIIAAIADEYARICMQQIRHLEMYAVDTTMARKDGATYTPPSAAPALYLSPLVRIGFIASCVLLCLCALVSHQFMTAAALTVSFAVIVIVMWCHVEQHRTDSSTAHTAAASSPATASSSLLLIDASVVRSAHCFHYLLCWLVGIWYCGYLFAHAALLLGHPTGVSFGVRRIVYTIVVTAGGENGGLVIGRLCGRHKLAPHISPNKSTEGFVAQIVTAALVSWLYVQYIDVGIPVCDAVWLGLVLGAVGGVGDLFESLLKRSVGVKDAGVLIPGVGGMLDRMDGLIFNFPLMFYYLEYAYSGGRV